MIALQTDADVDALRDRIRERNLCIQALTAAQAADLALLDELDGWRGTGLHDCADWVVCNLGYSPHNAKALVAAGHAARELPEIGDAFCAGELSVDKMKLLAPVVPRDDEAAWLHTALDSSPPELARRCREFRNTERTGPERDRAQRRERRLHTWWDEENKFRISGALPSYEGAIVQNVLENATKRLLAERAKYNLPVDLDPPDNIGAARAADALVWICETAMHGSAGAGGGPPVQMVVHVDYDVLTGADPNGRGHIEDGPALSTQMLRQLGCDATVKTLIERNGEVIAAGREKPTVSPAMKLRVRNRDGICRYPGCAMPARKSEAHHIQHWADGGPTELWNLLAQCKRHHDRHHDGEFDIYRTLDGDLQFVGRDGRVFGTATGGHWKRPKDRAGP